jgi:hypothetical protein
MQYLPDLRLAALRGGFSFRASAPHKGQFSGPSSRKLGLCRAEIRGVPVLAGSYMRALGTRGGDGGGWRRAGDRVPTRLLDCSTRVGPPEATSPFNPETAVSGENLPRRHRSGASRKTQPSSGSDQSKRLHRVYSKNKSRPEAAVSYCHVLVFPCCYLVGRVGIEPTTN